MNYRRFRYVLMEQAGEGAGGAGAADPAAGAVADPGPADPGGAGEAGADPAGTADAAATALAQGQTAAPVGIPEKYQVKKDDGSLDLEASTAKLAEAYVNAEKRIGSGDIPPKVAADYTVEVPDALKDAWKPEEDGLLSAFKDKAHKAGFTQAQFDLAIGEYLQVVPNLLAATSRMSTDDCVADLKKDWATDETYKAQVGNAYRALASFAGDQTEGLMADYGNDPRFVRMMAKIGGELTEDSALDPGQQQSNAETVNGLMMSEAYTNPKHPDHAKVSRQIANHFEKQANIAAKAGNAPLV